jgi:hypothetical protein
MKQQKEQVSGPWGMVWKTVASVSVILLMTMAFHQAAKSSTGRKALHGEAGAYKLRHSRPGGVRLVTWAH